MGLETYIVNEKNPQPRSIRLAAESLEKGGIVLVPTETGYCFVGDATMESTRKAFLAIRKAHPTKKPFSILCKDVAQASACAIITTAIYRVATRALPGPFTFILEVNRHTPKFAFGSKRKTVGVRISSHPVARDLVNCYGHALLITSVTDLQELHEAEYFDEFATDESDAWWVDADRICGRFGDKIQVALALNSAVALRVSTIVDFTQNPAVIVRDGGWSLDNLGLIT